MNKDFSEKDIKKVAKGAGTTLIGSSIGKGLFFLSQIIIARALGVEIFGLYALGFAVAKICGIISTFGLSTGGMRFVSIFKDESRSKLKGILISSSVFSFLSGAIIGFVLYILSNKIAIVIFHNPELKITLQIFAFSVPFISGMNVVASLLKGFHTTKYTVYTRDIIQCVVNVILIIVFHLVGFGLSGVIYAFILSHLMAFISGIFYLRKLFPEIKYKDFKPVYEIKDLILYSVPLLFIDFLHYFLTWTNSLLLGVLSTTTSVGIYRAASQLPLVMTIFMMATNSIYAPLAANLYNKGEMKRLESIFKTTTRWVIYITVPIFILIIFSPKELMMVFGREFIQTGWIILVILSFGQLINCMTAGVGMTLTMTAKQKLELFNSAIMLSVNILLCYLLIPKYGAIGAAIANCVGISLINLVRLAEVKFLYNMHPFSSVLIKYTLPSSISIIILFFLNKMVFQTSNIYTFFIKLCAIFIIFMVYFLRKTVWTSEDLFVYNKVKNIISKNVNPAKS